ncbi:MAG: putative RDD family membrane protein YckC, partial [Spirosomataceae bacterium]
AKILSSLLCCIGYLLILFRADEKGLHDLLANTYVVKS